MKLVYLSLTIFTCIFFVGCDKKEISAPASEQTPETVEEMTTEVDSGKVEALAKDAKTTVKTATEKAGKLVEEATEKAGELAEDAKTKLEDKGEMIQSKAKKAANNLVSELKNKTEE